VRTRIKIILIYCHLLMNQLQVPFFSEDISNDDLNGVSRLLDLQEKHSIDHLLWSSNGYQPEVCFFIAYTASSILVKYVVKEKYHKAVYQNTNDPVFKDSCVEMFIAFDSDAAYYNLEFNYLGTALAGYGTGKSERVEIKKTLVEKINSHHLINLSGEASGANAYWELTLNIPFEVFEHHNITSLKKQVCRVNFYKCGDELPEPHFLSWNNINYPTPNFHLPGFFGGAEFV